MKPFRPIHNIAKKLGFTEAELATLLLKLPGAPIRVERGQILVNEDLIEAFLEGYGIAIPAQYAAQDDETGDEDASDDDGDDADDA